MYLDGPAEKEREKKSKKVKALYIAVTSSTLLEKKLFFSHY
jgi:hypothetical protein